MTAGICIECGKEVFEFQSIDDVIHNVVCGECRMRKIEVNVIENFKLSVMVNK